jgi:hypothetical protein
MAKDIVNKIKDLKSKEIHDKGWIDKGEKTLLAHMAANPMPDSTGVPLSAGSKTIPPLFSKIALVGIVVMAAILGLVATNEGAINPDLTPSNIAVSSDVAEQTPGTDLTPTATVEITREPSKTPTPTSTPTRKPTSTPSPTTTPNDTLHSVCETSADCKSGQSCLNYFGIAGAQGPLFQTCEIPCPKGNSQCPSGLECVNIIDGPGTVCQKINVE